MDVILDDDNVQFQWCLISTVVEDATASQELLGIIKTLANNLRFLSCCSSLPRVLKQQTRLPLKRPLD